MPCWEGSIEKLARIWAHENAWRTLPELDEEDLLQEAFLVFQKVDEKYPEVKDPPHFIRLFKTALWRRGHDLARKFSHRQGWHRPTDGSDWDRGKTGVARTLSPDDVDRPGGQPLSRDMALAAEEAPEAIRASITALMCGLVVSSRANGVRIPTDRVLRSRGCATRAEVAEWVEAHC